jgi:hypothetical protein
MATRDWSIERPWMLWAHLMSPRASVNGFVVALKRSLRLPVSHAVYEMAKRKRRVAEFNGPLRECPACAAIATVLVRRWTGERFTIGCPTCTPRHRRCARCEQLRPIRSFDITPNSRLGFKFEPYCNACRRTRLLAYYFAKRDVDRSASRRVRCTACGRMKPRNQFFKDGRYKAGVLPRCKTCRKSDQARRSTASRGQRLRRASARRYAQRTWSNALGIRAFGRRGRR